jgi:protein-S-isoprenylcysteine O-methyltransferase Ste14
MTTYNRIIDILWLVFWLYWIISARGHKQVIHRSHSWMRYWSAVLFVAVILFIQNYYVQFKPVVLSWPVMALGLVICFLGLSYAVWARRHQGTNWNREPSIQRDHELITSGPYSHIRHPIYTGILTALIGSALVGGPYWLLIFIFVCFMFIWRVKVEEEFMTQTFPSQYPEYKKRTKALVPFVW